MFPDPLHVSLAHSKPQMVKQVVPSPKVIGHIEPSRAQFTNASTFDTTNSAAGLAEAALDVAT